MKFDLTCGEHEVRQDHFDLIQGRVLGLCLFETFAPDRVEQFATPAVGNHLRALEQAGAIGMVGVVVGVDHVLDWYIQLVPDKVENIHRLGWKREGVDDRRTLARYNEAGGDLSIEIACKYVDIFRNSFTQHADGSSR